jgi:hypothetical protein
LLLCNFYQVQLIMILLPALPSSSSKRSSII